MHSKLTAELFADIVSNLKSDTTGSRGQEKRGQGRVGLRGTLDVVTCSPRKETNRAMTVCVRDISINGIGLMVSTRMDEGLQFIARFVRAGRPPLCVLYKVRYCRPVSGDLMSVGASFDRVLPDANGEVMALGKSNTPKPVRKSA